MGGRQMHESRASRALDKLRTSTPSLRSRVTTLIMLFLYWVIGSILFIYKFVTSVIVGEPKTIFTETTQGPYKVVSFVSGLSLDEINEKRKSLDVSKCPTFSDYMLTIISQSITMYLEEKKEYIPDSIHLAIPANIRSPKLFLKDDVQLLMGNKSGAFHVEVPLTTSLTFEKKVEKIKSGLDAVKRTPEAHWYVWGMKIVSILPQWMVEKLVKEIKLTSTTTFVASNVNGGSSDEIFLCGARATDFLVVLPSVGFGLGFAYLTLNGKVSMTVEVDRNCGDEHIAKDLMRCLKTVLEQQGITI